MINVFQPNRLLLGKNNVFETLEVAEDGIEPGVDVSLIQGFVQTVRAGHAYPPAPLQVTANLADTKLVFLCQQLVESNN